MQVDPTKLTLKVPGTKRLKPKYDELLTIMVQFWYNFAFNFNLRRYNEGGRRRITFAADTIVRRADGAARWAPEGGASRISRVSVGGPEGEARDSEGGGDMGASDPDRMVREADRAARGATEGATEGGAEGATEGGAEGATEGAERATEGGSEGATEGGAEGATEGVAEGATEGEEGSAKRGDSTGGAVRRGNSLDPQGDSTKYFGRGATETAAEGASR